MKTLGNKIAENRKLKKMTQEDLANKLNVSPQAVSKWENDLSIPDLPILIELADLFNASLDALIREPKAEVQMIQPEVRKPIEQMFLRIVVNSAEGDKVRVNLPLALVKVAIETGMCVPQVSGNDAFQNIDFTQIIALVEQGAAGKLVEVESSDGDIVEIFVE